MKTLSPKTALQEKGLRDTQPRRMVLRALEAIGQPATPQQIRAWILTQCDTINLATVYRILKTLEGQNLVHRDMRGDAFLCSMPETHGHHGILSCDSCGIVREFYDESLCKVENTIAKRAKFTPLSHVSEISGLCERCS